MDFYQEHIKLIQMGRKYLYEHLLEFEENKPQDTIEVYSQESKNGEQIIIVTKDEKEIRLNSMYRPTDEAKRWVKQFEFKHMNTVVTMYGLGNGIFARELMNELPSDAVLLIYEPHYEIFMHTLHNYDITDLLKSPNVYIAVEGINQGELKGVLQQKVAFTNLKTQYLVEHPQYKDNFKDGYAFMQKVIRDHYVNVSVFANTQMKLGKRHTINFMKNLKYVMESNTIQNLKGAFPEDMPVIVVAAGPSLDKNVEFLKEAKNKALIICVDTAIKVLVKHGIEPDFIVVLDPNKSLKHFDSESGHHTPLFYQLSANRDVLDSHVGEKIIYGNDEYTRELFKQLDIDYEAVNSGGSVATAAFSICVQLGFKRIILIGQDLAFSGNQTHAGGVSQQSLLTGKGYIEVESIEGKPILTPANLFVFLQWFEAMIDKYHGSLEVIDATEGGAMIHGSTIMTLQSAIHEYCTKEYDVKGMIENHKIVYTKEDKEKLNLFIEQIVDELEFIQKKSKQLASACNDLIAIVIHSAGLNSRGMSLVKTLSEANKKIEELISYELIDSYTASEVNVELEDIYVLGDDELMNMRKTYEKSRTIYENMVIGARELLPIMKQVLEEQQQ